MASGTRGYSSYRGRGRKGKIFLAILLILIILASVAFIIAREHMTYDADGNLHFQLPWAKQAEEPIQPPETPDVEIQEPDPADEAGRVSMIQAVQLGDDPAEWETQLSAGEYNAFAVTVKASDGTLNYPFETTVPGRTVSGRAEAVRAALPQLLDGEKYSIARLSCLRDGSIARQNLETMGLKNTGGYVFYDGNNENWLDPAKEATRTYLASLAVECADLGFDEILLDWFLYPISGDQSALELPADKTVVLKDFAQALEKQLPEGTVLSVVLRETPSADNGVTAELLASCFDRVYVMPDADASALPTGYDRATRVVTMAGYAPESGSYLVTQ